jgi:hypothetical protein
MKVYSASEIKAGTLKTQRLLREFPELWGIRQDWGPHGHKKIKVYRAPAIHFLEEGIGIFKTVCSVGVYIAEDYPYLCDVAYTPGGNRITHVDQYKVGDVDEIALYKLTLNHLLYGENARHAYRIFVVQEHVSIEGVVVVKPPAGQQNFESYVMKLRRRFNSAT